MEVKVPLLRLVLAEVGIRGVKMGQNSPLKIRGGWGSYKENAMDT
jgi:hypothetical protein